MISQVIFDRFYDDVRQRPFDAPAAAVVRREDVVRGCLYGGDGPLRVAAQLLQQLRDRLVLARRYLGGVPGVLVDAGAGVGARRPRDVDHHTGESAAGGEVAEQLSRVPAVLVHPRGPCRLRQGGGDLLDLSYVVPDGPGEVLFAGGHGGDVGLFRYLVAAVMIAEAGACPVGGGAVRCYATCQGSAGISGFIRALRRNVLSHCDRLGQVRTRPTSAIPLNRYRSNRSLAMM